MDRRTVILGIGVLLLGVGCAFAYHHYAFEINTLLNPLLTKAREVFTYLSMQWNALPEMVRTLALLGIPTIFSLFLAWTKSRAMQQVQNLQLQTQNQDSMLRSSLTDNKQMTEVLSMQDQLLQRSRDALSTVTATQSNLLSGVQDTNTQLNLSVNQLRLERDNAVRDAQALQKEVEEFRKKYIVA